ncbi:integumentary mucin C.1-like [Arapaima gigas]
MTKNEIEPLYRKKFPTFLGYTNLTFKNGSIVTNGTLVFNKLSSSNLTASELVTVLKDAVQKNQVNFSIDINSIAVNGNVPTTVCVFSFSGLSLATLLLTAVLQY